jgi:thiaminase (transcriptional activator TenA)
VSDASSFSEQMRVRADRTWRAVLRHRFFREVATDAINERVFARYLRIEYGFVDTAARALGYAVAKAPSFQERRRLSFGLYGLVTDQEQVFVDAFERMGAPKKERTGLAPQGRFRSTRSFSRWRRRRDMKRFSPAHWRRSGCI